MENAKKAGKTSVILYGQTYIKFLLEYACHTSDVKFIEKKVTDSYLPDSLCLVGELNEEEEIKQLVDQGCISLLDLLKE